MSLPSCFCMLHWSTVSLKMPTYNSTLHLRNCLPRKIRVVWMFASYLRSDVTESFCTINDFACFCILLHSLVQNNEWYTCPGVCKLINFMDVAFFFFAFFFLAFCLGIFNRKGNHWKELPRIGLNFKWQQLDWNPLFLHNNSMPHPVLQWVHMVSF